VVGFEVGFELEVELEVLFESDMLEAESVVFKIVPFSDK